MMEPQEIIDNYIKASADLEELAKDAYTQYFDALEGIEGDIEGEAEFVGLFCGDVLYFDADGIDFAGMNLLPVQALIDPEASIAESLKDHKARQAKFKTAQLERVRGELARLEEELSQ